MNEEGDGVDPANAETILSAFADDAVYHNIPMEPWIPVCGVFELNSEGQIVAWRDDFDMGAFQGN